MALGVNQFVGKMSAKTDCDQAEALRQYIRQQGASLEMQNYCAEIRLRAERRAGGMLTKMGKNPMGQPEHEFYPLHDVRSRIPTYKDLGITWIQSLQ